MTWSGSFALKSSTPFCTEMAALLSILSPTVHYWAGNCTSLLYTWIMICTQWASSADLIPQYWSNLWLLLLKPPLQYGLCTKYHPIPYTVCYFWLEPYLPWSKVGHYIQGIGCHLGCRQSHTARWPLLCFFGGVIRFYVCVDEVNTCNQSSADHVFQRKKRSISFQVWFGFTRFAIKSLFTPTSNYYAAGVVQRLDISA